MAHGRCWVQVFTPPLYFKGTCEPRPHRAAWKKGMAPTLYTFPGATLRDTGAMGHSPFTERELEVTLPWLEDELYPDDRCGPLCSGLLGSSDRTRSKRMMLLVTACHRRGQRNRMHQNKSISPMIQVEYTEPRSSSEPTRSWCSRASEGPDCNPADASPDTAAGETGDAQPSRGFPRGSLNADSLRRRRPVVGPPLSLTEVPSPGSLHSQRSSFRRLLANAGRAPGRHNRS